MNERKRKVSIIFLSFGIPALVMLSFCIVRGIAPFGDNTFLYQDMKRQYVEFYSFYQKTIRQAATGGGLLSYSTQIGLGDTTAGVFSYYMTSPLLIPFLFLPVKVFPSAITFLITVKCALCGLTMCVYLGNRSGRYRFRILPFSTAYAFCGFALLNLTNTMWIDVMVLAPILILLCEEILQPSAKDDSPRPLHRDPKRTAIYIKYILCVGACLFLNYYIAWMVLLFAAVYGLVYIIPNIFEHKYGGGKEILCKLVNWLVATIWGGILSAVTSLPAYFVLKGSAKNISDKAIGNLLYIDSAGMSEPHTLNPLDILSKAFSLSFDADQIFFGYPAIYCGLLLVPLVLLFFMKKRITPAKKISALLMFIIMTASFSFDRINILWHAGSRPQGYLYRYSFLFSFLMITCAYEAFKDIGQTGIIQILCAFGITGILLAAVMLMHYEYLNGTKAGYNFMLLIAGCAVCVMLTKLPVQKTASLLLAVLFLIGIADAGLNLNLNYSVMSGGSLGREAFVSGYEERKALIEAQTSEPAGQQKNIFKIESTSHISDNDAMLLGYNGTATYSSLTDISDRVFMKRLGFSDNGIYTEYSSSNTASADAILSLTGIICEDENGNLIYRKSSLTLPMLIGISKDAANQDSLSSILADDTGHAPVDDPFAFTQAYLDEINGSHTDVLVPASVLPASISGADASPETDMADNGQRVTSYTVTAPVDGRMYLYISNVSKYGNDLTVTADDTYPFGNASCNGVICIGERSAGETFTVTIAGITNVEASADTAAIHVTDSDEPASAAGLIDDLRIVSEDTDALSSVIYGISEHSGILSYGPRGLSGQLSVSSVPVSSDGTPIRYAVCAVAYDPDIKASSGRKNLTTSSFAGEYLMIEIPDDVIKEDGTVGLSVTYKNTRGIAGVIITLLSLTGLVIFYIISRKRYSLRAE